MEPLLPSGPRCAAIVTSRRPLRELATASHRQMSPLDEPTSRGLLTQLIGRTIRDRATVDTVAAECAGLPLALRIVGLPVGLVRRRRLQTRSRRSRTTSVRLDSLVAGDLAVRTSLDRTLALADLDAHGNSSTAVAHRRDRVPLLGGGATPRLRRTRRGGDLRPADRSRPGRAGRSAAVQDARSGAVLLGRTACLQARRGCATEAVSGSCPPADGVGGQAVEPRPDVDCSPRRAGPAGVARGGSRWWPTTRHPGSRRSWQLINAAAFAAVRDRRSRTGRATRVARQQVLPGPGTARAENRRPGGCAGRSAGERAVRAGTSGRRSRSRTPTTGPRSRCSRRRATARTGDPGGFAGSAGQSAGWR